jgi:lysozyme
MISLLYPTWFSVLFHLKGMNMALQGIDVSHIQGVIDWEAVAGDASNIKFAYVKATEGTSFIDPEFSVNYAALESVGIKRGAYHFFHPSDPIPAQVQNFLKVLGDMQQGDLPPVLDVEVSNGLSPDSVADNILQWLEQVKNALNCTPLIYTSSGFWNGSVGTNSLFATYPLWIAEYTMRAAPILPQGASDYAFWQYSSTGSINGIQVPVDLDYFNGSEDNLNLLG